MSGPPKSLWLALALIGAITFGAVTAYALSCEFPIINKVEIWELQLTSKTIDGDPVDDSSKYDDTAFELEALPASDHTNFYVIDPEAKKSERMTFSGEELPPEIREHLEEAQ